MACGGLTKMTDTLAEIMEMWIKFTDHVECFTRTHDHVGTRDNMNYHMEMSLGYSA